MINLIVISAFTIVLSKVFSYHTSYIKINILSFLSRQSSINIILFSYNKNKEMSKIKRHIVN